MCSAADLGLKNGDLTIKLEKIFFISFKIGK